MSHLAHCAKCEKRANPVGGGQVICSVSGRTLFDHNESGVCPLNKFGQPLAALAPPKERKQHQPVQPIPRDKWPRAAKLIAWRKRDGERGVGDTLTRLLGKVGGDVFKAWYLKIVGEPCGCGDRAAKLTQLFPYQA